MFKAIYIFTSTSTLIILYPIISFMNTFVFLSIFFIKCSKI